MAKPVILPKFGFTQEEGTIVEWLVPEGEYVEKGDPVCEVTTDKVNMEVEAPASGYLGGLRYKVDDVVPVTEVIAYILEEGEEPPAEEPGAPAEAEEEVAAETVTSRNEPKATPVARKVAASHGIPLSDLKGTGPGGQIIREDVERQLADAGEGDGAGPRPRATPAARRVAREHGLTLADIQGRGPAGRIQEADVLATMDAPAQRTEEVGLAGREVPLRGMRRTIAERMQQSWRNAPHIDLTVDVDMSRAVALRERAKEKKSGGASRPTITAIIVKAAAWALGQHPRFNGYFQGGGIVKIPKINVGVAVDIPEGLIVPVVAGVDEKDLQRISSDIAELVSRARDGELKPEDVADATFTVSNLGMFGVDRFKAIINPPQIGILAVGRIRQRFVPDEQGNAILRPMMAVTLSADHRAVDGVEAAKFLESLREALEAPSLMLI